METTETTETTSGSKQARRETSAEWQFLAEGVGIDHGRLYAEDELLVGDWTTVSAGLKALTKRGLVGLEEAAQRSWDEDAVFAGGQSKAVLESYGVSTEGYDEAEFAWLYRNGFKRGAVRALIEAEEARLRLLMAEKARREALGETEE